MKLRIFTIVITAILLLAGCANNNDGNGTRDNAVQPTRDGNNLNVDRTRNIDNNRFSPVRNNTRNEARNDRYEISKETADRIVDDLDEVDRAHVLTTRNNAYVAVVLDEDHRGDRDRDDGKTTRRGTADNDRTRNISNSTRDGGDDHISDDLKEKVSDIVRSVDRNIDNVYVSTNPDFVDLTNNYVNDVNAGHPVRGFFDEMGNMIERIFPQNR